MIEGHGNDLHQLSGLKADFSSNVAIRQAPEALLGYLAENLGGLSVYPEPDARTLRKQLAEIHGFTDSQILVTNGSTEALYTIATAFRQSHSLVFTPSFAEYEDACRLHGHKLHFSHIRHFSRPFFSTPHLVWLGHPNNPDGSLIPVSLLREKLKRYPDTLFIVDEAYGKLCSGFESALPLLQTFENLVVVHSMTKLYAIPGLRLGYLFASKAVSGRLRKFMQPWSVNTLAQAAGSFLLQNGASIKPDVPELLHQSQKMQQQLSTFDTLEVQPSNCNFFLIKLLHSNAAHLKAHLLQHHGMLIRDASNFRGLGLGHIRLSTQAESENKDLCIAIKQYLNRWKMNG
jgi:threonine-phosphate decarboxylase